MIVFSILFEFQSLVVGHRVGHEDGLQCLRILVQSQQRQPTSASAATTTTATASSSSSTTMIKRCLLFFILLPISFSPSWGQECDFDFSQALDQYRLHEEKDCPCYESKASSVLSTELPPIIGKILTFHVVLTCCYKVNLYL